MPTRNVICIIVDRLHAGMVGAYGNSWLRTPALDDLSCQSFLFDQALVDSPQLDLLYRAYWCGLHAADARQPADSAPNLPQLLQAAGLHTALITDEAEVARLLPAADFREQLMVEQPDVERSAADISDTCLARLFGTASEWLRSAPEPFCLWVHSRGLGGPWDAPLEMRDRFAEEDDPRPPRLVEVPNYWLKEDFDPDEALGIRHAYAGQVALVDECLGGFCQALDESPLAGNTLLVLLSARGFPLGLHRRIGACDDALYGELAQLVWMMRFPDRSGALARSQALVQPFRLPGTLLEWLELDRAQLTPGSAPGLLPLVRGEAEVLGDRVLMISHHDRAIRTPAWHLRRPESGPPELYTKPSDRWEVNEVSKILPDVVVGLQQALDELLAAGPSAALEPLTDVLVREFE